MIIRFIFFSFNDLSWSNLFLLSFFFFNEKKIFESSLTCFRKKGLEVIFRSYNKTEREREGGWCTAVLDIVIFPTWMETIDPMKYGNLAKRSENNHLPRDALINRESMREDRSWLTRVPNLSVPRPAIIYHSLQYNPIQFSIRTNEFFAISKLNACTSLG